MPARRKFQAYLHNCAARLAADAANSFAKTFIPSIKNFEAPDEMVEAREMMLDAHRFRAAADILVEFSNPDSKFIFSDLLTEPITPTTEEPAS